MMTFERFRPEQREEYQQYLTFASHRGAGFSFANLYMWGHQRAAVRDGFLVMFSHFDGHTMYPFPAGQGNVKPVLDAILADAQKRGIPCRITGLSASERELLEELYPGAFRFHCDRDSFDYVYDINDLADLKGKKFQPKRNHVNRFLAEHPDASVKPLEEGDIPECRALTDKWFDDRLAEDPHSDLQMERMALNRAYRNFRALGLEGLGLYVDGKMVAMTMGSFLSEDTMDIHFEKGDSAYPTSYAVINRAFARYLREKYPNLKYLNREDDMGKPGLRKAKLSYQPHHMVGKCWAHYAGEEFND